LAGAGNTTVFGAAGSIAALAGAGKTTVFGLAGSSAAFAGAGITAVFGPVPSSPPCTRNTAVFGDAGAIAASAAAGKITVLGLAGSSAAFAGSRFATALGAAGSTTVLGGAFAAARAGPGTSPVFEAPGPSGVLTGNTTVFGAAGRGAGVSCGRNTSVFASWLKGTSRLSSLAGATDGEWVDPADFATSSGDKGLADSSYGLMADRSGVGGPLAKGRRSRRRGGASYPTASESTGWPQSHPRGASPNAATSLLEPPYRHASPWPPRMTASRALLRTRGPPQRITSAGKRRER
jgi:hypothetical protein